jgi:hypothetical protein
MAGEDDREDGDEAEEPAPEPKGEQPEAGAGAGAEDETKGEPGEAPAEERAAEAEDGAAEADAASAPRPPIESPPGDDATKDKRDLSEPPGGHRVSERKAAAWGRPLARLDARWTKFESGLCAVVLVLEILALSLWVALKGLSTPSDGGSVAGIVFRALLGATVLGLIGFYVGRKRSKSWERVGAIGGVTLGVVLAKSWSNVGIDWSSNLLNWYQQASSLTLLGGLRGVGTRLTLLLALLGGSLATAAGKHITIDLVTRFLKPKVRLPIVIFGWVGSALICGAAAWGFFDHIAIEDFHAKAEATPGEKFAQVGRSMGEDFFIARKQMSLDFKTLPHVMKGDRYAEWLKGSEWNAWLDESGFAERYGKEKAEALKMSDLELTRSPIVIVPDRGEPRGELIKAANLVFPIGLLIIAIRFLLLSLLAFAGHMVVDPEAHVEGSDLSRKRGADGEGKPGEEKAS